MHRRRKTSAHRWFHAILRQTFGRYLKWRYSLTAQGLDALKNLPQPWLVLPNHVMTWDPVLISIFIKQPIYFIASDANFRNRIASWWLRRVGAIPTSKQATDMTTLKQMMQLIRSGNTVGLFPEGERTWDGVTLDIIPATAKLARLAKVPVVVPVIKGGFLSMPRWSFTSRRGPVCIEYKVAVGADEIRTLHHEHIADRIRAAIHHDEYEYQKKQMKPYISPAPAEPLQLSLFICPECRGINCLEGRGRRFVCRSCRWEANFGSYGLFRPSGNMPLRFESIRDWSRWQLEELEQRIKLLRMEQSSEELFFDEPSMYSTGFKFNSLKKHGTGRLSLSPRGMHFRGDNMTSMFPWKDISALNVVYQNQLEFYFAGALQVFTFPKNPTSALKYLASGRIFQRDSSTT